jgi:Fic family protein
MLKADTLEATVWRLVVDRLLDPMHLKTWFAEQRAQAADAQRILTERQAAIAVSLQDVERKLGALLDVALTHDFPRAVVEERRKLLVTQQQRLEQERRQAQADLASMGLSDEHEQGLLTLAERLNVGIEHLDFAAQRKVLELLQIQVRVIERRKVKVQALLALHGNNLTGRAEPHEPFAGFAVEVDLTTNDVQTPQGSVAACLPPTDIAEDVQRGNA